MISRTTKIQLMVFSIITLLGVSYVGARYARLDRWFYDDTYTVSADFDESGGIFEGAEVTYRGVPVGKVEDMRVSRGGVYVDLGIDNGWDEIPTDVVAVVANRSAVGEQYVDLQPQTSSGPYLKDGSAIDREDTKVPLSTTKLLVDLSDLVNSIDRDAMRTVVSELGQAFYDTGDDLGALIDTGNEFMHAAIDNLEVTKRLIANSRVALQTQVNSESAIKGFTRDLALLSDTLVQSDKDLRSVIDKGSLAARDIRQLIEENQADIAVLVNNLITTNQISSARVAGIEQVLVLYPYVVEGGFTVVAEDPGNPGLYNATFGLVTTSTPHVCTRGYTTRHRPPTDLSETPLNTVARCTEPQDQSSARGAQNAPAYNRPPVVAAYDPVTGTVRPVWSEREFNKIEGGGEESLLGKDSWKWLLVGPLVTGNR